MSWNNPVEWSGLVAAITAEYLAFNISLLLDKYFMPTLPDATKAEIYSIDVSEDSTAIAVFKHQGDTKRLVRFYDVEDHMTETEEFMDLAYNRKFPTKKVTDQLILKK